ncbi:NAD(P)H-dependent oxidoreductase [Spongiibacter taiwanensis]|uniref:NAD(P)H-dependent oxidoreductase n=1 Tax=Spongiibacter taiwanensis TaxID=1748242 RepID=UPI0020358DEF|nr:NAD(P)H-dependent oxidoreductase [Spongiibacter taiwanensis]USA42614.1 NAD(P)H-dependent oxidoreductase [Spongiibacter taiwanensis]
MKVFVVFAHPEAQSFGAAMLARGVAALEAAGHEVVVSDLYQMGFNPIASNEDFLQRRFPERLQYDREQKYAATQGQFSKDIETELEKLFWCDHLVLQFPLWWFSVPAIMKGWIDRVFVNGKVYGAGLRWENGGLKGKRASLAMTTGCFEEMVAEDGILGSLDVILWHLHAGVFHYSGLEVLPPFVSYAARYTQEQCLDDTLESYARYLTDLNRHAALAFHPSDAFENWRLKTEIKSEQ